MALEIAGSGNFYSSPDETAKNLVYSVTVAMITRSIALLSSSTGLDRVGDGIGWIGSKTAVALRGAIDPREGCGGKCGRITAGIAQEDPAGSLHEHQADPTRFTLIARGTPSRTTGL